MRLGLLIDGKTKEHIVIPFFCAYVLLNVL
jgi:hypothetical protein